MRVQVDFDQCDNNELCVQVAPEVFGLDAANTLVVRSPRPAPKLWPVAEAAARACPKLAITLVER